MNSTGMLEAVESEVQSTDLQDIRQSNLQSQDALLSGENKFKKTSLGINNMFPGLRISLGIKELVKNIIKTGTYYKRELDIISDDIFPGRPGKVEEILKRNGIKQHFLEVSSVGNDSKKETCIQGFLSMSTSIPAITLGKAPVDSPIIEVVPIVSVSEPEVSIVTKTNDENTLVTITDFFPLNVFDYVITSSLYRAKKVKYLSVALKQKILEQGYSEEVINRFLTHFEIVVGRKKSEKRVKATEEMASEKISREIPELPVEIKKQPEKIQLEEPKKEVLNKIEKLRPAPTPVNAPQTHSKPAPIIRITARGPQTYYPLPTVEQKITTTVNFLNWFERKILVPRVIILLEKALSNGYIELEEIGKLVEEYRVPKDSLQSFLVGQGLFRGRPTVDQIRRRMGSSVRKVVGGNDEEDI